MLPAVGVVVPVVGVVVYCCGYGSVLLWVW